MAVEDDEIGIAKLRQDLRQPLPDYMLNRQWLVLDASQRTPNGKRPRISVAQMIG